MKNSYLTLGEAMDTFKFTDEQLEHMIKCVQKHGLTNDDLDEYVNRETIKHFTMDFVFGCVVDEIYDHDPIMAVMAEKIAERYTY